MPYVGRSDQKGTRGVSILLPIPWSAVRVPPTAKPVTPPHRRHWRQDGYPSRRNSQRQQCRRVRRCRRAGPDPNCGPARGRAAQSPRPPRPARWARTPWPRIGRHRTLGHHRVAGLLPSARSTCRKGAESGRLRPNGRRNSRNSHMLRADGTSRPDHRSIPTERGIHLAANTLVSGQGATNRQARHTDVIGTKMDTPLP